MLAEMGPLTHCHICLALLSLRWVAVQTLPMRCLFSSEILAQMPFHALSCSAGILTLGSAESLANLPLRKAHLITEVAHVPAAIRPVALAMLVFALLMLVGAIPMAVKP